MLRASAVLTLSLIAALAGCATAPSNGTSDIKASLNNWAVKVSTESSLKKVRDPNALYALISPQPNGWELISVSRGSYPARSGQQEIFRVSEDLSLWETTIPSSKYCNFKDKTGYSVCTSALAKRDMSASELVGGAAAAVLTVGVSLLADGKTMLYDENAIRAAVNSISEAPAHAQVARLFAAEEAAKKAWEAAAPERDEARAACVERYQEETRRLEAMAAPAIAAAQAGKKLSLLERTYIAQAQMRLRTPNCQ